MARISGISPASARLWRYSECRASGTSSSSSFRFRTSSIGSGEFLEKTPPPDVLTLSLLNYRSELGLEQIIAREARLDTDMADRREAWKELGRCHPAGLVIIIDELSEFLRSKADAASFAEDVRFLQFLGEWAQSHPLWVIAAMQEQIEHTGDLESSLYRKIKDRFPLRLMLSTQHTRELVSEGILRRREGADEAITGLLEQLRQALPDATIDLAALASLYPVHPGTLDFLEEVRDLFSQARGAVDFVLRRLEGDPAAGIEAFLDRPFGEVMTPDLIVDHFSDLFELQPDFLPIAQKLLPWYRRHEGKLFGTPALQQLGRRILKLLVLVYISPGRERLDVDEAVEWLLVRVGTVNPETNRRVVEKLLRKLVIEGRWVVERGGGFALDFGEQAGRKLETLLAREMSEIAVAGDEAVWEMLHPLLESSVAGLFDLPCDRWQQRSVSWHFHQRAFSVFFGNAEPPVVEGAALLLRLPWGRPESAEGIPALIPPEIKVSPEIREMAALLRLRRRELEPELRTRIKEKLKQAGKKLGGMLRQAYAEVVLEGVPDAACPSIRLRASMSFETWLTEWAFWCLRRLYPGFEQYAPGHGPLPKEAYRCYLRAVLVEETGFAECEEYLKLIHEAYLVPMGLVRRRGLSYEAIPKLESHKLVAIVLQMLRHEPRPRLVYQRLSEPIYGLLPDQIHLLLLFLLGQGEIDLMKGKRSCREVFETLPLPLHYDRLVVGRGLAAGDLKKLGILTEGLGFRLPGQWTPGEQRKAVLKIANRLDASREGLLPLLEKLSRYGQAPQLEARIERFLHACSTIHDGRDLEGLEHFLFETGSPSRFCAELRELEEWPRRLDLLIEEIGRFKHLLGHPLIEKCPDPGLQIRVKALMAQPAPESLQLFEAWLTEARTIYDAYIHEYRSAHDQWLARIVEDPIWSWNPPALSASIHLGLMETCESWMRGLEEARGLRCRGLGDLRYQPQCSCGFDFDGAAVEQKLEELRGIRGKIEKRLRFYFSRPEVRERIAEYANSGLEKSPEILEYLKGRAELPAISDIRQLDRHLAGVEPLKVIDLGAVISRLEGEIFSPEELVQAISNEVHRLRASRLRVLPRSGDDERTELLLWCLEQSLRNGVALPGTFRETGKVKVCEHVHAEWVSEHALSRLEDLGLGREIEERIIGMLLSGRISLPKEGRCGSTPLLAAAEEILRPEKTESAEEIAASVRRLYRLQRRFLSIAPDLWSERIEEILSCPIPPGIVELENMLKDFGEEQWLVIDCFGILFLPDLRPALERGFAAWEWESTEYALVSMQSTTDAWLRGLAEAGISHRFEKINTLDRLIHESRDEFGDLCRLAAARLENALRQVARKLDTGSTLRVFADHGFRLAENGRGWVHGGNSVLERVVPVISMRPRKGR